jgi:DNA repair exonuclease SbcCD ATPase subunit
MRASVDNARMADRHRSRADNIEAQLATSIYDDDADAVERLEEKLAALEARRAGWKAENAVYRAAHRAELKAMTPYERSQAVPHPTYQLSNLGGTISRTRERIARLRKEKQVVDAGGRGHGRQMASRYGGVCPDCGKPFERGDAITWYRLTREAVHAACPETDG